MKSSKRQRLISFLCVFLVTIISVGSITAMASSKYCIATIKPNSATSTIADVKKEFPSDKASGIIAQRSSGQKTNYFCYIWVKDTTKSKVLSDKKLILVTSSNSTHNINYKSGVSTSKGDTIRFYGSQASAQTKGLSYAISGDKIS